jgi:hypothetical protein
MSTIETMSLTVRHSDILYVARKITRDLHALRRAYPNLIDDIRILDINDALMVFLANDAVTRIGFSIVDSARESLVLHELRYEVNYSGPRTAAAEGETRINAVRIPETAAMKVWVQWSPQMLALSLSQQRQIVQGTGWELPGTRVFIGRYSAGSQLWDISRLDEARLRISVSSGARTSQDGGKETSSVVPNSELLPIAADRDRYLVGQRSRPTNRSTLPISIYLSDERIHEVVESAVDEWLTHAGLAVVERDEPIIGSWFGRMRAGVRQAVHSPAAAEAALTAVHAADSRLILAQDAVVTATLLQNLGPVITSLQTTKDAVIRAGALLIVKVDWTVQVYQLTAAQQAVLDHQPRLASSPQVILAALELPASSSTEVVPSGSEEGV